MVCEIRRWREDDAEALAGVMNDRAVQDNLRDGLPFPYTVEDGREFIDSMLRAGENSTYAFAITVDDRAVGSIGVFRQANIHARTAEMGYCVAKPWWGKGIASCAVGQVRDYIFQNTDIMRIFAEPFDYNTGSCRVLEKCGFVCEGVLRKNAVKNGRVIDMRMYAIVKE